MNLKKPLLTSVTPVSGDCFHDDWMILQIQDHILFCLWSRLHMVSLRWVTRSVMTLLQEESTQGRGCGAEPLSLEYSHQLTTERAFLSSLWWQGCFSKGSEMEDFHGSVQANTRQPHSINWPGIWVSHSCCLQYACLNWQPEDDSVFLLVYKSSISKQMMRK